MSVVTPITESPVTFDEAENERKFEALCNLIELSQGSFSLSLVEFDLPSTGNKVLDRLHKIFEEKGLKFADVVLAPPPSDAPRSFNVLDEIEAQVSNQSKDGDPDVLIITSLETLFPDAIEKAEPLPTEDFTRAVRPLNMGRNVLSDKYPCPVLFCLPKKAMALFLAYVPDITTWLSGTFQFHSDLNLKREEIEQTANKKFNWWTRQKVKRLSVEELEKEAERLKLLIADAKALPADLLAIAQLYHRAGWVYVFLHNRSEATKAFSELQQRAAATGNSKLSRAAERGLQAAQKVRLLRKTKSSGATDVFIGATALSKEEGLFGRENELRNLVAQATRTETRFLTVWGETGCGKTSLVQAGFLPRLTSLGHYLPAIIRQWNDPESEIRAALKWAVETEIGKASDLSLNPLDSLHDWITNISKHTKRTVVIVCDQFEQFFKLRPNRSDRKYFLSLIGKCVNDLRLQCKFIFVIREDELGCLTELDDCIKYNEPLGRNNRFFLPLFDANDAFRVLRQMSEKADLGWADGFIRTVVDDLKIDERVRPVELQLVGAALQMAGINTAKDYASAGGKSGLLTDYLELAIEDLYEPFIYSKASAKRYRLQFAIAIALIDRLPNLFGGIYKQTYLWFERRLWKRFVKRVLLALVAEPEGRLTLSANRVAQLTPYSTHAVTYLLEKLDLASIVHWVSNVTESSNDIATQSDSQQSEKEVEATVRWELTHDIIAELTLLITRDIQDSRRKAVRVLRRAIEDQKLYPSHRISLLDWWTVQRHGDQESLALPEVRRLLRRSLIAGIFTTILLPIAAIVLLLAFIQNSSGHITFEHDYGDRVVIRRGTSALGFLPLIGEDIILDTGYSFDQFKRDNRQEVQDIIHREWRNQQSGFLVEEKFWSNLDTLDNRFGLLIKTGRYEDAFTQFNSNIGQVSVTEKVRAESLLGQAVWSKPDLQKSTIDALIPLFKDNELSARLSAAYALGQAGQANPQPVIETLLPLLKDNNLNVKSSAINALGQVDLAKLEQSDLQRVINALLLLFKDNDPDVKSKAAYALGQVGQANPQPVIEALLPLLKNNNLDVKSSAAYALGQVGQADPQPVIEALLPLLKDNNLNVKSRAAHALGQIRQAKLEQADLQRVINALLPLLKDNGLVKISAANALGQIGQADPQLVIKALLPLLNDNDSSVKRRAALALGQVGQAKLEQSDQRRVIDAFLLLLKDNDPAMKSSVASALGQVGQANPQPVIDALLPLLKDNNLDVKSTAINALGQVGQADPQPVIDALLPLLKDNNPDVKSTTAYALVQVSQANSAIASERGGVWVSELLPLLSDINSNVKKSAATAIGRLAKVNLPAREKAIKLLESYDKEVRDAVRDPLAEVFLNLALKEQSPTQFFFDHLEGRESLMSGYDANTCAEYRRVIIGAMARLLVSDEEKAIQEQGRLREKIEEMRDHEERLHLRIAAWDVLLKTQTLEDQKKQNQKQAR